MNLNKLVPPDDNEPIELTDLQKQNIIKAWRESPIDKPPSLKDLINIAFPHSDYDGRSLQGKAVKSFLANHDIKPKTNVHNKIGEYILTLAEKEFIENNIQFKRPIEIVRDLFSLDLTPLSKEFRAVKKHIDTLNYKPESPEKIEFDLEESKKDKYTPPSTYTEALRFVNKYTHESLSKADISEREKAGIYKLIEYLHSPIFVSTASTCKNEARELFVSEFIRATYDKSDLTSLELNSYINLCFQYVIGINIRAQIETLNERLNEVTEDSGGKISMTLTEALTSKTKEYNDCLNRQKAYTKDLNGSRAERMKNQISANASVLSLVEFWKDEKKRKRAIHLANLKKNAVKNCIEEIATMDSVKAEMFGTQKLY